MRTAGALGPGLAMCRPYERPADRTPAGYRRYGPARSRGWSSSPPPKHLGLALDEIASLLVVRDTGSCAQVRARLGPQLTRQIEQAEHCIAQLRAFTSTLRTAVRRLDALRAPCDCGVPLRTWPTPPSSGG